MKHSDDNQDRRATDLIRQEQQFPEVHIPRSQLAKSLAPMEFMALVSRLAMDLGSEAYVYAVLKLIMAAKQADLLKQTYQEIPPHVEEPYRRLTDSYMALMEAIPQQHFAQLLAELERSPASLADDSLLAKVRAFFGG